VSRCKDTIMNVTEAMKAISPPAQEESAESPRASESATEQPGRAVYQPSVEAAQEGVQRRPWWRRVFAG
jgi:hypothetical protein